MKRSPTHSLALFLAAFPLVGSAFVALAGLVWGLGLQCDESCGGDDWQHTAGAPQWTVLTVMAVVVFGSGIALYAFVYWSRPWQALAALAFGAVTLAAALRFWGTDWNDEFRRHPLTFGALAAILLSGALAAFLSAPADNAAPDASDHPRDATSVRARNWITWLFVALGALCVFWVLGEIWFAVTQSR